jgi:hypothetical protein
MSYISVPPADEGECPTLLAARTTLGFIPKVYRAQTRRPELIDAEVGLIETKVIEGRPLTRYRSAGAGASSVRSLHHRTTSIPAAGKALLDCAIS